MDRLCKLLFAMLKVGCIGFGGGNALIPFIEREVVKKHKLISEQEYNKYIVISNITPGALPVEMAVALGRNIAGIPGMLLAPVCIAMPGVLLTILLIAAFSRFSGEAILQVKYISVGISVFIMYLLFHYNAKIIAGFELTSMKLKRAILIACVFLFTCGKEMYDIFGIERTSIFDISTLNVLLISFFVIFSSGKKMNRKKFMLDAIIVFLYVLCVGKGHVIQSDVVLWMLRGCMLVISGYGIYDSFRGSTIKKRPSFRNLLAEEGVLMLFLIIGSIPALLLCRGTLYYIVQGYISSLISFGGGEAYLTVAESMFLDNGILKDQLYIHLLPVVNALPGSVLTKMLSGIGYYTGLNETGSMVVSAIVAISGFIVAIVASGAVICAVKYVYEIFEDLKIFELLRKTIRPIVGGLLLSTSMALFREVLEITGECEISKVVVIPVVAIVIGVIVAIKRRVKIPDSIMVVICGVCSLVICNMLS